MQGSPVTAEMLVSVTRQYITLMTLEELAEDGSVVMTMTAYKY
jgi:hypothetical protein